MYYNTFTTYNKLKKQLKGGRRIYLKNFNYPDDKYEVVKELGSGGTSQVFLVKHKGLNAIRAIKKISKNDINRECFFVEINVLNSVNIKGIPMIYDVDEDNNNWYIVEEYVEGILFSTYLDRIDNDIKEVIGYICDLCVILNSLHSIKPVGVIYRDLSPDNIIISESGIYIVDFGNCLIMSNQDREYLMATGDFAAPEQFQKDLPGVWTDVYSIGMLLQKVYRVYQNKLEDFKLDFLNIMSLCLEKNIKDRFSSVIIIKDRLNSMLNNLNSCEIYKSKKTLSINIYVYGCRRYAGVTHFSLGFSKYLSDKSYNAMYFEDNGMKDMINLFNNEEDYYYKDGVYTYERCRIRPGYGEFCMESDEEYNHYTGINIHDCGLYLDRTGELKNIVIVVITDIKSFFEFKFDNHILENEKCRILYVANFSEEKGIRKLLRQRNIDVIKMPFFENPFILDRKSKDFYEEVLKKIFDSSLPKSNFLRRGGYI